jgi:exosortase/archaeosortase
MEGLVVASNAEMLRFVRALGFAVERIPEDRRTVRIVKKL